jgi:hypothetical protein
MKPLLLLMLFSAPAVYAQNPEGWDTLDQIIKLRADLKSAIRADDKVTGANITNTLVRLSDKNHLSLMWDERWLVYHWCGRYKWMLNETAKYSYYDREEEEYSKIPPVDSLFELIDKQMYQQSTTYPEVLKSSGLNFEEQFFADIHLEYLLRNNTDQEKIRRDSFIRQFPNSKYNSFIRQFMSLPVKPVKHYFSLDVTLFNSNWSSGMALTARPGWGMGFGLYYHRNWFVGGLKFEFSKQKLLRDLYSSFDVWPKGSASGFNKYTAELGANVLNRPKIRVAPAVEFGFANFSAQDSADEDNPDLVPLSAVFNYQCGQIGFSVTSDLKMFKKGKDTNITKSTLYNGIRLKLGYNWLYFGSSDTALTGNVLFFALGYQFSGR